MGWHDKVTLRGSFVAIPNALAYVRMVEGMPLPVSVCATITERPGMHRNTNAVLFANA